VSELTDRIRAAVERDKQLARACIIRTSRGQGIWRHDHPEIRDDLDVIIVRHTWPNEAAHIVHNDPATVLRKAEAHEEILDRYDATERVKADLEANHPDGMFGADSRTYLNCTRELGVLQPIVVILAVAYRVADPVEVNTSGPRDDLG